MKEVLGKYSRLWLVSLLGVITVILLMVVNKDLRVCNILEIEFSDSTESFLNLVKGQESNVRHNTLVDFVFILAYTILFWMSLKVVILSLQTDLKRTYYLLCLLPGIFDVVENLSMLNVLENQDSFSFKMLFLSVRLKWGIVIPFMLMTLTILLFYILVFFGIGFNIFYSKRQQIK
ncbi:hypothetical protein [Flagellimonas sp.]|uniref:hypothetical protein n=1 Tax=Flagellimonas sp. TaxID=2058762 RepID=UPI003B5B5540